GESSDSGSKWWSSRAKTRAVSENDASGCSTASLNGIGGCGEARSLWAGASGAMTPSACATGRPFHHSQPSASASAHNNHVEPRRIGPPSAQRQDTSIEIRRQCLALGVRENGFGAAVRVLDAEHRVRAALEIGNGPCIQFEAQEVHRGGLLVVAARQVLVGDRLD